MCPTYSLRGEHLNVGCRNSTGCFYGRMTLTAVQVWTINTCANGTYCTITKIRDLKFVTAILARNLKALWMNVAKWNWSSWTMLSGCCPDLFGETYHEYICPIINVEVCHSYNVRNFNVARGKKTRVWCLRYLLFHIHGALFDVCEWRIGQ